MSSHVALRALSLLWYSADGSSLLAPAMPSVQLLIRIGPAIITLDREGWMSWFVLHSLHGGGPAQVAQWQNYLAQSVQAMNPQSAAGAQLQQAGFMIHAMGDAYAHIYAGPGGWWAFPAPIGHALQSHNPDVIMHSPQNYANYAQYVQQLYSALGGQGQATNNPTVNAWLSFVQQNNAQSAGQAAANAQTFVQQQFGAYNHPYTPGSYNQDPQMSMPSYSQIWQWMQIMQNHQSGEEQ